MGEKSDKEFGNHLNKDFFARRSKNVHKINPKSMPLNSVEKYEIVQQ